MTSKFALIIANTEYTDPGLAQLTAPGKDAREFWRVLDSSELSAFDDVIILLNEDESKVRETIDYFFSLKKPDDLLVLYFSGHGVRDEYGSLYLAVRNTNRARLRSTAIKTDFIREAMDQSRSKRQVLILDCCNSGAFAQGTKAETGGSMGTASAFQGTGFGRVVLTASDATQFAWEGDQVIGETQNSLFTHFLVKGLEGEADTDGDGRITVDELYDYAYEQIVNITPKQTPGKWSYKQQGEIVLRDNLNPREHKPVPLPSDLLALLSQSNSSVRKAAIQDLISLLNGKHLGLALSAEEMLREIAANDDSLVLRKMAGETLVAHRLGLEGPAPVAVVPETTISEKPQEQQIVIQPQSLPEQKKAAPRLNQRLIGGIAGGLLIVMLLIWGGSRALSTLQDATPAPTNTVQATATITSQPVAEVASQSVIIDTPVPTETPIPVTPTLGIGSFRTSKNDDMILLYVPAGKFTMGDKAEDALAECQKVRSDCRIDAFQDEAPPHDVDLAAFWIDQTEVTNKMYARCVNVGECTAPSRSDSNTHPSYYLDPEYDDFPVIYVDWNMAKAYCRWSGRRLPTEAEWEKAARGIDERVFPWGNFLPTSDVANFGGLFLDTTRVKQFETGKSPYGAYDMAGNVYEWVADWYDPIYYPNVPSTNPSGPHLGEWRVYRGGSWYNFADVIRSAIRGAVSPSALQYNLGFRCAMDATP